MSSDTAPYCHSPRWHQLCLTLGLVTLSASVFADCTPGNTGTAGPDQILCDNDNDPNGADVSSLGGDDVLDLNGGTIGTLDSGSGRDTINLNGSLVENNLLTGDGDDTVIISNRDSEVGTYFSGGLDTGAGNDRIEISDGLIFRLDAGDGDDSLLLDEGYIFFETNMGAGDDTFYWDEGVIEHFIGGTGSDEVVIDAFAYEGEAILDGGDDLTADDGYIDTLKFILDHEIDGQLLRNWERIIVQGSSKIDFFGSLDVGGGRASDGQQLGLDIWFGGVVEFVPRTFNIRGDVINAGTLWLNDNRINQVNIASHDSGRFGNYTGRNGRLWMETTFGDDSSPSDLLTIAGDAAGTTFVRIYNLDGDGGETHGDGIKVIDIAGKSPANAFILDGDYMGYDGRPATVGGAYGYTLHHGGLDNPDDGNWYLRSTLPDPFGGGEKRIPRWQPGAVLYETYAQAIRLMSQPESLRQRVGNRFWAGSSHNDRGECCYTNAVEKTIDGGGLWLRTRGHYYDVEPEHSTANAKWQQDFGLVQIGSDFSVDPAVYGGRLIFGVSARYGYGNTELDSFFGHGKIRTDNWGVGSSLTWYGHQGTYADLQMQFNWFDSELYSHELYYLGHGNDAVAFSFSAEAGHSIKLCDYYSLTPQVQLTFNAEEIDDNYDQYGVFMKDTKNRGGSARFGLAFEQRASRRKSFANMYGVLPLERIGLYAIANAHYYFDDETEVKVSHTPLYQARDDWWGQLGVGVTYDECGDRCSFYAEADYSTSLSNFGDSYGASLTVGFRFKW